MNIAVLIGVSDYKVAQPLPACTSDVSHMRQLLTATGKYDDICTITTQTEADPLKEALRRFFSQYQGSGAVKEAFVYFSGHGLYHTDALLCCSDFDTNRPASTSLSNSEIDDLLRSVAPEVAVKIIDACQSGSPYIKDATPGFEKALRESKLKSFICMASSRADQSSYATAECSLFTSRLIDSVLAKEEGTVLYRDIQAGIADAFVATPEQTPFFVTQGTGLESFAAVTTEMKALTHARSRASQGLLKVGSMADRISAEIQRMDTLYVSAESASRAIDQAGVDLERATLSSELVAKFYTKRVIRGGKLATLPRVAAVAEFAVEQHWAKKYFVKVEKVARKVRVPQLSSLFRQQLLGATRGLEEKQFETRLFPSHLESTQPLPFEVAEVHLEPVNHPSLRSFVVYIGLVHSLTEVVVLSAVGRLTEKGWTERAVENSDLQWRYQNHLWRDVVARPDLVWDEALKRGQEAVQAYIEGFLPKTEEAQTTLATGGQAGPGTPKADPS